jgi:hypothetical protein
MPTDTILHWWYHKSHCCNLGTKEFRIGIFRTGREGDGAREGKGRGGGTMPRSPPSNTWDKPSWLHRGLGTKQVGSKRDKETAAKTTTSETLPGTCAVLRRQPQDERQDTEWKAMKYRQTQDRRRERGDKRQDRQIMEDNTDKTAKINKAVHVYHKVFFLAKGSYVRNGVSMVFFFTPKKHGTHNKLLSCAF